MRLDSLRVNDTPRRRARRRQGHADEVAGAQGPAPDRRPRLIERVLRTAAACLPASITLVVGHGADEVKQSLAKRTRPAVRRAGAAARHRPRAAADARRCCEGKTGTVVLLSGDVPLLAGDSLKALLATHTEAGAAATVITANMPRPFGYGRIVRTSGRISKIVEERDASPAQKAITEINSGIYAFDLAPLFGALDTIGTANKQGEYYLPDLGRDLSQAEARGRDLDGRARRRNSRHQQPHRTRRGQQHGSPAEERRVDGRRRHADRSRHHLRRRRRRRRRRHGDPPVRLPRGVHEDRRGVRDPRRRAHRQFDASAIACVCATTLWSRIPQSSRARSSARSRTSGRVRSVGEDAHIGNFVELKKTTMGKGAKANHLAYLGDATIGAKTNVGAGTITCNYDGEKKHQTVIGDGVFVGSNSTLVAPVTLADGAYIAAGSAVTDGRAGGRARRSAARARKTRTAGSSEASSSSKARQALLQLELATETPYVRNHRLHRAEARRARHPRRTAAARISRL